MIKSLSRFVCFFGKKKPTIEQVRQCWSGFSEGYNKFDLSPQTFYYSFLNMTHIWKSKNILEVACGTGKILPLAVYLKDPSAKYLATDLSPDMINLARTNLKKNFDRYESKLSYEDWLKKTKIQFKVANGEEPLLKEGDQKFDRIICNCVLMLTADAEKMLRNLYDCAAPGCLMGVSVWGDKNKNNLMTSIRSSIIEAGIELPDQRSNFYLYKKIEGLAEKCGWQIVLNWQQNALFPVIDMDDKENQFLFYHQVDKLPEEQRQKPKEILTKKLRAQIIEKKGLNFSCQLLILKKK